MSASLVHAVPKSERLVSLDVFRGITIGGMILVNNPGTWGAMYPPLKHASWHGWTPTDFIFPFFLFIIGVAMTFSFDKRIARGDSKPLLIAQVIRRAAVLLLLGFILGGFPRWRLIAPYLILILGLNLAFWDEYLFRLPPTPLAILRKISGWLLLILGILWWIIDFKYFNSDTSGKWLRIPGVLNRIAICYFAASLIMMVTRLRGRILWIIGLLVAYWAVMALVPAPADYTTPGPEFLQTANRPPRWDAAPDDVYRGELNDFIDVKLFGAHLYSHRPDPEGFLSSVPAVATVLLGILVGMLLRSNLPREHITSWMFVAANGLLVSGWVWSWFFPINKKIWTSSYVLFMAGMALMFLAVCYWLIDVKGWKRWTNPFLIFGTNSILLFFGSGIMARIIGGMIQVPSGDGTVALKTWTHRELFLHPIEAIGGSGSGTAMLASFLWSLVYLVFWLGLLYPLYRKRIFLKV